MPEMNRPSAPPPQQPPEEDPRESLVVSCTILAVVALLMAGLSYWSISSVEAEGGKLNIILALLYRIGGKWLPVGLLLALAAGCAFLALRLRALIKRSPWKK